MILLPTRRRPERVKKFFESAKAMGTTSPGVVIIDSKDYMDNTHAYLSLERRNFLPNWKIHITKGESMGDKLRELWGYYSPMDWACLLNDDHVFRTHEWDKRLVDQLTGSNFISCSDGWKTEGKKTLPAGATIWSGSLIRAVGYIFPPRLHHMFIDNIWMTLGQATKCWTLDETVIVEHEHATRSKEWKDETHEKSESFFFGDNLRYVEWRSSGEMDRAVQAIKDLQCKMETEKKNSPPVISMV